MDDLPGFRKTLMAWFDRTGRDYPWRRTHDPYAVLVSELMLQQTQVATVLEKGYFTRWMERFPDPASLAAAGESEVLRLWEGLGYYRRARHLHAAAREVVAHHGGRVPVDPELLVRLPGLGRYSAAAVASFAGNKPVAVVDANVARVIARLAHYRKPVDSSSGQRFLWEAAERWLAPRSSRRFNSGIMELGQRVCLPRRPECEVCPVARWCQARDHDPAKLPVKAPRRATVEVIEHAVLALRRGKLLLECETGRRREGLWKLPQREAAAVDELNLLEESRYTITHHRVTLRIYRASSDVRARRNERWIPMDEVPDTPMPAPYRRVVDRQVRIGRSPRD